MGGEAGGSRLFLLFPRVSKGVTLWPSRSILSAKLAKLTYLVRSFYKTLLNKVRKVFLTVQQGVIKRPWDGGSYGNSLAGLSAWENAG